MTKRIVFTGGSGKAGKHAVPHLLGLGYQVLNIDLKPLDCPGVHTLTADLTESGQAFNALTTHFGYGGYDLGKPP
jgi:nucleoside-diphosphate-sugar epimerase